MVRWIGRAIDRVWRARARFDGESEVMLALVMATFYGAAVASAVWWPLT